VVNVQYHFGGFGGRCSASAAFETVSQKDFEPHPQIDVPWRLVNETPRRGLGNHVFIFFNDIAFFLERIIGIDKVDKRLQRISPTAESARICTPRDCSTSGFMLSPFCEAS
jgi:hypothetical protein